MNYTTKYDNLFQRYSAEFFPEEDWKWFKAQAIAESALQPLAESVVGAMGLMQLMPPTAIEMAHRLNIDHVASYDPEFNIRCGIGYDRRMWNIWKQEVGIERLRFMFASYNAGAGNIIKAQRLATVKDKWDSVSAYLHRVTGVRHSNETLGYVRRIEKVYAELCRNEE